jgi:hypothetical protein
MLVGILTAGSSHLYFSYRSILALKYSQIGVWPLFQRPSPTVPLRPVFTLRWSLTIGCNRSSFSVPHSIISFPRHLVRSWLLLPSRQSSTSFLPPPSFSSGLTFQHCCNRAASVGSQIDFPACYKKLGRARRPLRPPRTLDTTPLVDASLANTTNLYQQIQPLS